MKRHVIEGWEAECLCYNRRHLGVRSRALRVILGLPLLTSATGEAQVAANATASNSDVKEAYDAPKDIGITTCGHCVRGSARVRGGSKAWRAEHRYQQDNVQGADGGRRHRSRHRHGLFLRLLRGQE
jgi:hypothetical protein